MNNNIIDSRFQVELISKTPNPQQTIYAAMHQDYSENFVFNEIEKFPSEEKCGDIIVNRLLAGGRGHYGCYTPDTEVLTRKGWVKFPDLNQDEEVLMVDTNKKSFFEKPSAYQHHTIDDKLYYVDGNDMSLAVTLDHRMLVSHKQYSGIWSDYYFTNIENVAGYPRKYFNSTFLNFKQRTDEVLDLPSNYDPNDLFKLAGFFIGRGKPTNIRINTRFRRFKEEKINYLFSLNFKLKLVNDEHHQIIDEKVVNWLRKNFTKDRKKYINWDFLNLKPELASSFLEGIKVSSGFNKRKSGLWFFTSTNEQVIDFIQSIYHLNNYSCLPMESVDRFNNKRWTLKISTKTEFRVESLYEGRTVSYKEKIKKYKGDVYCLTVSTGAILVRRNKKIVVCGNCLEHPQIILNCGYFPHSVMQQATRHRHMSFDVQSGRYSGERIVDAADGNIDIEDIFYLRPVGYYTNREGKKYYYSQEQREDDLKWCLEASKRYAIKILEGMSEEHARGIIPFDFRQHFVVSCNVRSVLHFLDLRSKKDAQLEIQQLCDLIFPHIEEWTPAIAKWYKENRLHKAKLAP